MAEFLISKGAKINDQNKDSKTALEIAYQNCHEDMIKLLKNQRGNINTQEKDGSTYPMIDNNNNKVLHKSDHAKSEKNLYIKYAFTVMSFCIASVVLFTSTFLAMCFFVATFIDIGFCYYDTCEYQKNSNIITSVSQISLEQAVLKGTHLPGK